MSRFQTLPCWRSGLAVTPGTELAAEEAAVQVYECHQGGKVTFSETPCAGAERSVEVDYSRPNPAQARQADEAAFVADDRAGVVAQAAVLDAEILNLEQHISNLQTEREARVSALRDQLAQGTERLDSAAWEKGMNQQIVSTYNDLSDTILARAGAAG